MPSQLNAASAIGAVALVALATGTARGAAPDSASQSRVIDRTLLCRPAEEGGPDVIRIVRLSDHRRNQAFPPRFLMQDQGDRESQIWLAISTGPGTAFPTGGLWLSRTTRCTTSRLRLPPTSKGLKGAPTGTYDSHVCNVPPTVFIRIRAVFRRPAALAPDPKPDPNLPAFLIAKGTIENGYLAITTTARERRSIAFASVTHATGKARLFLDPRRCYPD
jgi:hypothetical protein